MTETATKTAEQVIIDPPRPAPASTPLAPQAPKPPLRAGGGIAPIIPQDIDQAWRLAGMIAASGTAPKSYRSENGQGPIQQNMVCVAILAGMEVGLAPMQAVQGIAVINGMPTVYSDAQDGLVVASGLLVDMKEENELDADGLFNWAKCTVWRKGRETPISTTITRAQAARAGWLKKAGPWTENPNRMAQRRARGWTLRDAFPDVLKGLIDYDEAVDMVDVTQRGTATTAPAEPARSDYVPDQVQQTTGTSEATQDPPQEQGWPLFDEVGEQVGEHEPEDWIEAWFAIAGPADPKARGAIVENNRESGLGMRDKVDGARAEWLTATFTPKQPDPPKEAETPRDQRGDADAKHAAYQEQLANETTGKHDIADVGLEPDTSIIGQENMADAIAAMIKKAPTPEKAKAIKEYNKVRMNAWTSGNRAKVAIALDDRLEDLANGVI